MFNLKLETSLSSNVFFLVDVFSFFGCLFHFCRIEILELIFSLVTQMSREKIEYGFSSYSHFICFTSKLLIQRNIS